MISSSCAPLWLLLWYILRNDLTRLNMTHFTGSGDFLPQHATANLGLDMTAFPTCRAALSEEPRDRRALAVHGVTWHPKRALGKAFMLMAASRFSTEHGRATMCLLRLETEAMRAARVPDLSLEMHVKWAPRSLASMTMDIVQPNSFHLCIRILARMRGQWT